MKVTEEFIVLRNTKDGQYLVDFKSKKNTFAFSANFSKRIQEAAYIPEEFFKVDKHFNSLAAAVDCEPIIVTANYELKTLDGEEPVDLIEKNKKEREKTFKEVLAMIASEEDKTEED